MKKNEMKHLSRIELNNGAVVVLESIKNSVYGCPRYEAIVLVIGGAFKVRVEGYKGTRDLAYDAYLKVMNKFNEAEEDR